jgi:hypothetical protein
MAEAPENVCELLDIDLDRLSGEDKVNLIREVCDVLTVEELRKVRAIDFHKITCKVESPQNG